MTVCIPQVPAILQLAENESHLNSFPVQAIFPGLFVDNSEQISEEWITRLHWVMTNIMQNDRWQCGITLLLGCVKAKRENLCGIWSIQIKSWASRNYNLFINSLNLKVRARDILYMINLDKNLKERGNITSFKSISLNSQGRTSQSHHSRLKSKNWIEVANQEDIKISAHNSLQMKCINTNKHIMGF